MKRNVAVLGSGSWGTALSLVLTDNGHYVNLWGNNKDLLEEINQRHENRKYLPSVQLPLGINAVGQLAEAVKGIDTIVLVVPTKAIRSVCQQLLKIVENEVTIVHASKGIEPKTSKRISEMIQEELPDKLIKSIVVLSGPSHAEEVALRQPTTVTAASEHLLAAEKVQNLFMNQYFRVYTNDDVVGVELGGALKNIIALGCGMCDGLGYGDNAKAALMTRGVSEITRLGSHFGADPITFAGLSGVGDLIVTCTSQHSRNWKAGNLLGQGYKLNEVLEQMGMIVEGVKTCEAAFYMAKEAGVDTPIINAIYRTLFSDKEVKTEVNLLMSRSGKEEFS
ncbi:NAD(P)H-dependent glycerol-3-phosphate dehydrogenase [Alteribacter populi]|uniref:NAD(P)H-dependent glycerol-3-phosphate dehydrogenase n=1 Tax=Alteribacter populi TaxID=2011011 RepID=UPI000BBA5058|nr:NAD(P)H-dependent glycerol-3-phosphate dehydrogenase [Alteribacter populi]